MGCFTQLNHQGYVILTQIMKNSALIVLLLLSAFTQAQQQMDLRTCVETAVANNLQIRQGSANVYANEYAVQQSRLSLLPNLNFSANYFFSFGRGIDYVTNTYVAQSFQSNSFTMSSNMSLYNGGVKSNTIKKAGYDLEVAKLDQQAMIENIQLNTILAYLQVIYAEDQVVIAENKKAISTNQLENSKKLAEAGSIPAGNLLTLEAQIASDELNLVNARNTVASAYLVLKNILQMDPAEPLQVVPLGEGLLAEVLAAPMPRLNDVIAEAIRNLPGIQRYEYSLKSAESQVKIASGYGLPSLMLIGQLNTSYSNASILPGVPGFEPDPYDVQIDNNLGEVVGLTLSIPIFNNGQVAISKQNASLGLFNTEMQQQLAINDLKTTVTEAWTGLQAAALTYDAAMKSKESAQMAFEFAEAKFQAGASNSLDYTIAVNNLAQADISLSQSKFDYIFKRKVIDYYLGKPIEF